MGLRLPSALRGESARSARRACETDAGGRVIIFKTSGHRHGYTFASSFLGSLLIVFCASLVALQAQGPSGAVSGRVTGVRGGLERILVYLFAEGDLPAGEEYTDSSGSFSFRALPSGTYWVVVQIQGYRPARQAVVLDMQLNQRAQVNLSLEPATDRADAPAQVISGSARSFQLNAKGPTLPLDPKALREFETGNKLVREGKLQAAATRYQRALEIAPDFYPALNNLGAIFLRQKEPAKAEALFLKAIKMNPADGEAYINAGHLLYEQGRYREAVSRLEEGLKRSPKSALGYFFLGSAYLKLDDLDNAERNLKTACSLDATGLPRARLQLANLYLRKHDLSAASTELEAYLRASPSDPQAPAIKKLLANFRDHRTN